MNILETNIVKNLIIYSLSVIGTLVFLSCHKQQEIANSHRVFTTSFESIHDFDGFYLVPLNYMNSSSHELSAQTVHSGNYAHKAYVYAMNPQSTPTQNNNHRAYPTIQFQKTPQGVFHTPCYITFWVWVDMQLKAHVPENEWLSFATTTIDSTDNWSRTILANLSFDGYIHLMHVPLQGQKNWIYQNTTLMFPQKEWVKIRMYIDTRYPNGYAKLWQNDVLVSYAKIADGNGLLAQAHFGLYAAPSVTSGTIFNDDLEIKEVDSE